ncbi:MAG: hypothetical protein JW973_01100 [Bacteroidales bacterium]|nr:hypothetical protein [Bacteroidales bacterium]
MLLRLFNSNKAGLQILFPAIAIFLWLHALLYPGSASQVSDLAGPLGRLLVNPVTAIPILSHLLAMILVILYGYLLIQLNAQHSFLKTRSQLPQLFFIIICGSLLNLRNLSPALLSAFFIIILTYRLFKTYKKEKLVYNFFDAGLLTGIATMFYIPAVIFLPMLLITLILFRNTVWQEWLYPWIGFCIPFLFWGSYLFITEQSLNIIQEEFRKAFLFQGKVYNHSLVQLSFYGYLAFLIIIGSLHMIRTIGNRKIQSRAFFIFFLWLFILNGLTLFMIPSAGIEIVYTGGISLSFLLSNYFTTCNNTRFNNILLFILVSGILLVIANEWFEFIPAGYCIF